MNVIADSQAIVWYLADDPRLGPEATKALDAGVEGDGVGVEAASLIDLWYATHKRGDSRIDSADYAFLPPGRPSRGLPVSLRLYCWKFCWRLSRSVFLVVAR